MWRACEHLEPVTGPHRNRGRDGGARAAGEPRGLSRRSARSDARAACGVELWSLKTLSDPQRRLVRLHPRPTLIGAINGRPMPRRTPTRRSTSYERQVWQVVA